MLAYYIKLFMYLSEPADSGSAKAHRADLQAFSISFTNRLFYKLLRQARV